MKFPLTGDIELEICDDDPIDISIPLQFGGPQPNAYGVSPATSVPCEAGDLIGDTRLGGSCNFEQVTLIPHCNGTHTECVGHIAHERISVRDCLKEAFIPALLVSIEPGNARETSETYAAAIDKDDKLITRQALQEVLRTADDHVHPAALIVRALPNDVSKMSRRYRETIPPYFTNEAIGFLVESGVRHLLVDLPSIDRLFDEGDLSNHRIFWNVPPGSFETDSGTRMTSTITELIYVPNTVDDGRYLLNLQIAPFAADASPSRPLLFRYSKAENS